MATVSDDGMPTRTVKENTQRIVMNLNKNTDIDIITHLGNVPSKQGYIKTVIRKDIAENESE